MSRFIRPLLNVAIAAGLGIAAWPLGQHAYGLWSQKNLERQWQEQNVGALEGAAVSATTPVSNARTVTSSSAALAAPASASAAIEKNKSASAQKTKPKPAKIKKWPLTRLSIPDIDLKTFVVQGWDDASLRRGPGHYPPSALPGSGNCVIAGHRNVYGSPFYRLDELLPGSKITLENRYGTFNYTVLQTFPTPDTNTLVLSQELGRDRPMLTLITCTIPHTSNRVILQAVLDEN